jgi:site-specific recombinase XerC
MSSDLLQRTTKDRALLGGKSRQHVREFIAFTGLQDYMRLRSVGRSHIISWRIDMERRGLAPASIRRKLSALSSLFDYLCERNAVTGNPVDGVKRPMANGNEGSTPALGDAQARKLLEAPPADTLKGVRDRAILATLLYHGIRREELCGLRVKDLHSRQGVMHFRVKGKRSKAAKATVHSKALFRDRNQTIKRTLFTLEGRSDQSARIHAQRLKLFKFGSLEPNNSDSFVSLPLEQRTRGVFRRCYPSFVLKLRDPRLPDALVIECDPAICHLADACAFIQERYIRFF